VGGAEGNRRVLISEPAAELTAKTLPNPNQRQMGYRLLMTDTVLHEIGHAIGIRHHREETGGATDCAMRYLADTEYEMPGIPLPQTRYC